MVGMRMSLMLEVARHSPAKYADWEMAGFGCSRGTIAAGLLGPASMEAQVAMRAVVPALVRVTACSMAQGRCRLEYL